MSIYEQHINSDEAFTLAEAKDLIGISFSRCCENIAGIDGKRKIEASEYTADFASDSINIISKVRRADSRVKLEYFLKDKVQLCVKIMRQIFKISGPRIISGQSFVKAMFNRILEKTKGQALDVTLGVVIDSISIYFVGVPVNTVLQGIGDQLFSILPESAKDFILEEYKSAEKFMKDAKEKLTQSGNSMRSQVKDSVSNTSKRVRDGVGIAQRQIEIFCAWIASFFV